MSTKTKIDRAGRLVIPKELREQYGLETGTEVELVPVPDGIALLPVRRERRLIRSGRVLAVDTGADRAPVDIFDVRSHRDSRIDRSGGISK